MPPKTTRPIQPVKTPAPIKPRPTQPRNDYLQFEQTALGGRYLQTNKETLGEVACFKCYSQGKNPNMTTGYFQSCLHKHTELFRCPNPKCKTEFSGKL